MPSSTRRLQLHLQQAAQDFLDIALPFWQIFAELQQLCQEGLAICYAALIQVNDQPCERGHLHRVNVSLSSSHCTPFNAQANTHSMKQSSLKKPEEVRAEFERKGISIAEWSRKHGANPQLVYEILAANPRRTCKRGASHRVAVLLGIKAGELADSVSEMNVVPLRTGGKLPAKAAA